MAMPTTTSPHLAGGFRKAQRKTWLDYSPKQQRVSVSFPEVKALSALIHEGGQDLLLCTIFMEAVGFGWTLWEEEIREINDTHDLHESLPSWLISTLKHELRTELSLCNYGLHPRHGALIAHALNHSDRLQRLVLQHNALEDEGVIALAAAIAENTSLTEVHLVGCAMGNKGCIALAAGLATGNCPVQFLQLCHNRIGDSGVTALAEVLPKTQINELNISDNSAVTDKVGGQALAAAGFTSCGAVYLKYMAGGNGGAIFDNTSERKFKWGVTAEMPRKASERSGKKRVNQANKKQGGAGKFWNWLTSSS